MVTQIRLYIEGGGRHSKATGPSLRKGFHTFLGDLVAGGREKRIRWHFVACGTRVEAHEAFCRALRDHPEAFNILLVDAERPVAAGVSSWEHLRGGTDKWSKPAGADDEHCHLMVQMMEAWFAADIETLKDYYGKGFKASTMPARCNVEGIPKADLEAGLKAATRDTAKGEYHKTRHGFEILERLDAALVRKAAPHCDRLFQVIEGKVR